jgi:hypothetical protein
VKLVCFENKKKGYLGSLDIDGRDDYKYSYTDTHELVYEELETLNYDRNKDTVD